jgi:hypothetical protein
MALYIEIRKTEENSSEVIYTFSTDLSGLGKVSIHKKTGDCNILKEPENDVEHILSSRVCRKLAKHWQKGEFPDITCWAS